MTMMTMMPTNRAEMAEEEVVRLQGALEVQFGKIISSVIIIIIVIFTIIIVIISANILIMI